MSLSGNSIIQKINWLPLDSLFFDISSC